MEADLSIIAKKHVHQGFQNNEDILSRVSALEVHLNDVFGSRQPSTLDYDNRRDLIRILNEIAKEIYGKDNECPVVEGFGSFLMDMFTAKSDLDLSINFSDQKVEARRDVKIKALRKFANKFYSLQKKKHVTNVQTILSARVPLLKVTDCGTGIECDLSVGNKDGITKSHIILMISSIDERFKKLCFLMKAWAKAHDINSSKDGTLNSLSLILLVAFHLQSREPPILPPFSAIVKDGTDPEAVRKKIPAFLNYGKGNKESLADLFVSLLVMLESVETLWGMGLCVSTCEGSWIYKTWDSKKGEKIGLISIEDFTDRSQNTARAVKTKTLTKIFPCIRHSVQQIRSFTSGRIDAQELKNRLFGPDALTANNVIKSIGFATPKQQHNSQDPIQGKRKRANEKKQKRQPKKKRDRSSIGGAQAQAPPHPNPPLHSNPPVRSPAGFRNERNHAEIWRYPTPNHHHYHHQHHHSFASTSGSSIPYHPTPYVPPPVSYIPHLGQERSYNSSKSLPSAPFLVPDNRNFRGFASYNMPGDTSHQPNPRGGNGAYPRFFYNRAP